MSIETVLSEGRLIRKAWSRVEAGRQLLCLYTAMVDDPNGRPGTCPAALCPTWLAHLLPWMDDYGSEAAWPALAARVAKLAPGFGRLSPEVEWRVRAACVREAMTHTTNRKVIELCDTVITLCDRRGRAETVSDLEFMAARTTMAMAAAAEEEAAAAAARIIALARSSTVVAAAAAVAAAVAAMAMTRAAARARAVAEMAMATAAAVVAAAAARAAAVEEKNVDRLSTVILDLIAADLGV